MSVTAHIVNGRAPSTLPYRPGAGPTRPEPGSPGRSREEREPPGCNCPYRVSPVLARRFLLYGAPDSRGYREYPYVTFLAGRHSDEVSGFVPQWSDHKTLGPPSILVAPDVHRSTAIVAS